METNYEKFKPKSKFLAIVAKFKRNGLATEDGALPGNVTSTPGAVPVTGTTNPSVASNPATAQAQDKVNKDMIELNKKKKIDIQNQINTINSGMGQISNQTNSPDPQIKATALAAKQKAAADLMNLNSQLKTLK